MFWKLWGQIATGVTAIPKRNGVGLGRGKQHQGIFPLLPPHSSEWPFILNLIFSSLWSHNKLQDHPSTSKHGSSCQVLMLSQVLWPQVLIKKWDYFAFLWFHCLSLDVFHAIIGAGSPSWLDPPLDPSPCSSILTFSCRKGISTCVSPGIPLLRRARRFSWALRSAFLQGSKALIIPRCISLHQIRKPRDFLGFNRQADSEHLTKHFVSWKKTCGADGERRGWNRVRGIFFPSLSLILLQLWGEFSPLFSVDSCLLNHKADLTNARGNDVCGVLPANTKKFYRNT